MTACCVLSLPLPAALYAQPAGKAVSPRSPVLLSPAQRWCVSSAWPLNISVMTKLFLKTGFASAQRGSSLAPARGQPPIPRTLPSHVTAKAADVTGPPGEASSNNNRGQCPSDTPGNGPGMSSFHQAAEAVCSSKFCVRPAVPPSAQPCAWPQRCPHVCAVENAQRVAAFAALVDWEWRGRELGLHPQGPCRLWPCLADSTGGARA